MALLATRADMATATAQELALSKAGSLVLHPRRVGSVSSEQAVMAIRRRCDGSTTSVGDLMQIACNLLDSSSPAEIDPDCGRAVVIAKPVLAPMLWLIAGGCAAAAMDTSVAIAWWGAKGVAPEHILQSFSAWFIGSRAFAGGMSTALAGAVIYAQLMCLLVALYHVCARRFALLWRRPLLCGGVYGAMAYFAVFQLLVPTLTGAHPKAHDPSWIAACVVAFMVMVGPSCALFSRTAEAARQRQGTSPR